MTVTFTALPEHIGFTGIVHGGVVATVLDEAMVWAATFAGRRFCVCGEMNVRFRASARVGQALHINARVDSSRARLIITSSEAKDSDGQLVATGTGKYVPLTAEQNREFIATLVDEPETAESAEILRAATRVG